MASKLLYKQDGFSGGMQSRVDATRIARNAYPLGINVRNRKDVLQPIPKPDGISLPAIGNLQGVYAAGNYLLIFLSGRGYVRNYGLANPAWQDVGLQMDPDVPVIYAELVPASSVNRVRAASSTNANSTVNLTSVLATSPRCVVVQDGVNQPWIIESNGVARKARAYGEWSTDNREYVPVGLNMLHHNGKLYILSRDRTKIYHSVTGRPLDFGVAVDTNGVIAGIADDTAHSVGYSEVTCMAALNSPDGGFYVGTITSSHRVVPDFENTIFGEPQFDNVDLFPTGPLNQFCFSEVLGDSVFIDFSGVRSFNAVAQTQNEGKNTPFARDIHTLFEGIVQSTPCVGRFDNYTFFGLDTIYGSAVAVYDELTQAWVGVDIYSGVAAIKQFAEVKTSLGRRLFFITTDDQLYEALAGDTVETAKVFIGEFCSGDPSVSQKPLMFRSVFINAEEAGDVSVTPYADRVAQGVLTQPVEAGEAAMAVPVTPPFGAATADNCKVVEVSLASGFQQGWKHGFWLQWGFPADLSHVSLETDGGRDEEALASRHDNAS